MSDAYKRCYVAFLAFIFIAFHAETARTPDSWKLHDGKNCYWRRRGGVYSNELTFTLKHGRQSNANISQVYASLANEYKFGPFDGFAQQFCIKFRANHLNVLELLLSINSEEKPIRESKTVQECVSHDSTRKFHVSFNITCQNLLLSRPEPELTIISAMLESLSTSPVSPTVNDEPTTDVGDIQYVGVVVGAICIALFTLFSCLTIISARRSNQRDTRRRTVQSVSCQDEDENRPDVVADNAPPSYDAVMACPDLYPPTPQGTPHGSPATTPHLSLHRRALLNQHAGSQASCSSATPQLQRQSITPTVGSEDLDETPEYPPPPYYSLSNGDVTSPIPGDSTDHGPEAASDFGFDNQEVGQHSRPSSLNSPIQEARTSSTSGEDENPWILNNTGSSHVRNRGDTGEHYPMRERSSPENDDTSNHSTNDSHEETGSEDGSVEGTTMASNGRTPKFGPPDNGLGVAIV